MIEIKEQLAKDTVTILKVYKKGIDIAKKPTFGKKRKQLNDLQTDLDYLIGEYEKKVGIVELEKK